MSAPAGPAGVFDRAAATYDAVGVPWFGPIAAGLVAALEPQPGERVLDVGCGRGAVLGRVAPLVGAQGRAVGLDLAPEMVRRTAADLADLEWVEVLVGDAQAPDLPPRSYDVVASSLVLFFLDDPAAALRRWTELLVPGGRLGVTTFGEEDPRWRSVDAVFGPYLPARLKDARTSGATGPFDSDAGMEALLAEAGLVEVRTVRATVEARFRDVEHLLAFTWSHGQRAMWEAVPETDRDAVRTRIVERVAELGLGAPGFTFTQDVRHTLARRPLSPGG
ncbi:class I SAM-dependent methyltransferase [Microlunatus antarcticus]|uniref:SAM-dependent methyltransferase n=1 Tax=Microlunatus antarcticus TaxID=53388 RepID=A0A7W5P778_9ACTN|nr:methyltransferase domain-containing protein [Microlunatus antarcticus]MBB3327304.1 SAM-dependent methyltransferase [Microlunatus antarcticus]